MPIAQSMGMKRILILTLALSHFETVWAADSLVAPPAASMEFQEAAPAARPMKTQTVQPADVAMQQPLPQGNISNQAVVIPAQPVPNISNQQSQQQAMTLLQQFMQMLGAGGGQIPGSTPMYLPNGQLNPAWVEANRPSSAPYTGRVGIPNYDRTFPGLEQAPMMNAEEAARRLKGHHCTPNDRDRLACMVCNLMYEAGSNEPPAAQLAVVRSVMTRAFSAPYPNTVCGVVYQHKQYSWVLENKNHTLPNSSKVDELIRISMEGMKLGPNGLTNYFAFGLVNPEWGRTGECARTAIRIPGSGHQFCTINGRAERSVASYLSAEGLPTSAAPISTSSQTAR
jgi:hypothetical protein